MRIRILKVCLDSENDENPLEQISHFHWQEDGTEYMGYYDLDEMWNFIKQGNEAYVRDPGDISGRHRISAHAYKTSGGEKYIATAQLQGQESDLLLQLPRCDQ